MVFLWVPMVFLWFMFPSHKPTDSKGSPHLTWKEISFVQVPGRDSTRNDAVSDRQMSGSPRGQCLGETLSYHQGKPSWSLEPKFSPSIIPSFEFIQVVCFTWSFSGPQVFFLQAFFLPYLDIYTSSCSHIFPSFFPSFPSSPYFFTNDVSGRAAEAPLGGIDRRWVDDLGGLGIWNRGKISYYGACIYI